MRHTKVMTFENILQYPDMNLEYLMRIGVWDNNAMTPHQVCVCMCE
jgi:hypothetical protein